MIREIARETEKIKWKRRTVKRKRTRNRSFPPFAIPDEWPLAGKLDGILNRNTRVGNHVKGVIASVNELIDARFDPLPSQVESEVNRQAKEALLRIRNFCFTRGIPGGLSATDDDKAFTTSFLRAAALYHDVGKYISDDHHVSRGVHLMRDVNEGDRKDLENGLFGTFKERRDFWAFLRHHDIFGCLCTGEASLPALFDIVGWSPEEREATSLNRSPLAYLSYLALLNIADSDSSLFFNPNTQLSGITSVEVCRYLNDWEEIKDYLWNEFVEKEKPIKREQFKSWSLGVASHPERTIRRITRLVASCYRAEMSEDEVPEIHISRLVEDELQSLHGARIEHFCYLFARFCKMDYGLRFFYTLMRHVLQDPEHALKRRKSPPNRKRENESEDGCPKLQDLEPIKLKNAERESRREICLRNVVHRTCLVLGRIVEDYAHLVGGDQRTSPLLCVIMSGLMTPEDTGWAICRSLKEMPSRALGWISDEIGVRLYGE